MINAIAYQPADRETWDAFVRKSKNATFLHERAYMDYHATRFADCSLIFVRDAHAIGLLPASIADDCVTSHAGLTYGGMLMSDDTTAVDAIEMLALAKEFYKTLGAKSFVYRKIPSIYCSQPSDEDIYALSLQHAELFATRLSAAVNLQHPIAWNELRRRCAKKAENAQIVVKSCENWTDFWSILTDNLHEKYNAEPVHSLDEMQLLHRRFPENIELLGAFDGEKMLAGVVVYKTKTTNHTQYIAASHEGKSQHAIDLIIKYALARAKDEEKIWFDLGTSNEGAFGEILNDKLIFQKYGFGARGVAYQQFKITL